MTDGIGRLSGYGNYGVGGFVPQRKNSEVNEEAKQQEQTFTNNYEETQVDPSKVMDFLANNNFFTVKTPEAMPIDGLESLDETAQERFKGYMEQFEMIYGVVQEEFGEELAPTVMDMIMDRLMGMS